MTLLQVSGNARLCTMVCQRKHLQPSAGDPSWKGPRKKCSGKSARCIQNCTDSKQGRPQSMTVKLAGKLAGAFSGCHSF